MDALMTTGGVTATNSKQYIVVKLDNEEYGIDIKYVDNIVRMQKITRVPKSQDYFVGVINLRGEILPVMSMRKKFGMEPDEVTNKTRIIIVKPEQAAMIGIVVDSINEVVTLDDSCLEKAGVENGVEERAYVNSVGKYGDELISILSLSALIAEKEQLQ